MKDLASVSLKNPVRIFVNSNTDVAPFLRQEFIRIRPNREGDREAIVAGEGPGVTRQFSVPACKCGLPTPQGRAGAE